MKEVRPMAENINLKSKEDCHSADNSLTEETTYDFDKNSFVVEPVPPPITRTVFGHL